MHYNFIYICQFVKINKKRKQCIKCSNFTNNKLIVKATETCDYCSENTIHFHTLCNFCENNNSIKYTYIVNDL